MNPKNLDEIIKHAAAAAAANAVDVRAALNKVVAADNAASRIDAFEMLRIALVAQAAGHESVAHNGSTFAERREHARAALAAWPLDESDAAAATPPLDVTAEGLDAAARLMDDNLREELHGEMVGCTPAEFLEAYCARHRQKFGVDFKWG